jgi:glycerol-3-phosphate acyltransferase PlsY
VSHFCGVDVCKIGSGNPGVTNVVRTIGKRSGILVFLGDFLKSFAAVALVLILQPTVGVPSADLAIATMLSVVLGHNSPICSTFKGGNGASVVMRGTSALMSGTAVVSILLWLVIFHATGCASAASRFFAIRLPIASFAFGYSMQGAVLGIFTSIVFFWCHRSNIRRLWNGFEYRFERKQF